MLRIFHLVIGPNQSGYPCWRRKNICLRDANEIANSHPDGISKKVFLGGIPYDLTEGIVYLPVSLFCFCNIISDCRLICGGIEDHQGNRDLGCLCEDQLAKPSFELKC